MDSALIVRQKFERKGKKMSVQNKASKEKKSNKGRLGKEHNVRVIINPDISLVKINVQQRKALLRNKDNQVRSNGIQMYSICK